VIVTGGEGEEGGEKIDLPGQGIVPGTPASKLYYTKEN
jgi:hypothetical protein